MMAYRRRGAAWTSRPRIDMTFRSRIPRGEHQDAAPSSPGAIHPNQAAMQSETATFIFWALLAVTFVGGVAFVTFSNRFR